MIWFRWQTLFLFMVIALTACASPEERAKRRAAREAEAQKIQQQEESIRQQKEISQQQQEERERVHIELLRQSVTFRARLLCKQHGYLENQPEHQQCVQAMFTQIVEQEKREMLRSWR
jgi:hypothetical protein